MFHVFQADEGSKPAADNAVDAAARADWFAERVAHALHCKSDKTSASLSPSVGTSAPSTDMSAKDDARFQHIAKMVAAQLSTPELPVTAAMVDKGSKATWVQEFMGAGAEGVEPRMALIFFLQAKDGSGSPSVYMASPEAETLAGKCCYVVRLSDPFQPLPTKDVEDQLNFGTIAGNGAAMQTLNRLVGELYNPLIAASQFGFKKKMGPDQVESLEGGNLVKPLLLAIWLNV